MGETIVRMEQISKRFSEVIANDHIDFEVKKGEIHTLLGENGAGKTTLMNILYGFYQADEGGIYIRGQKVHITSPSHAINLGIGMVHQHFMLIPRLTVSENVAIGLRSSRWPLLDTDHVEKAITEQSKKYGLKVSPRAIVNELSLGEQQRVEIIKALYRKADLIILDEPTSVLTPQEVGALFRALRFMVKEGLTIIFITHKLDEVELLSDRVTVLRDGKKVATLETCRTNKQELARMMVGRSVVFDLTKPKVEIGKVVIELQNVWALNDKRQDALKGISLSVHEGEIFGIAGISGNGQRELAEVIVGLRRANQGKVFINGRDMTNRSPKEILKCGLSYIPEKRTRGLIEDFTVTENLVLKTYSSIPFVKNRFFLDETKTSEHAEKLISRFDIRTPSKDTITRILSGGNLQKTILARELSLAPKVLIAEQPTRGLDVAATEYVRRKIIEQVEKGTAVLLISEDLNEVLSLSDRLAVLYEGEIVGIIPAEKTDIDEIGLMMAGAKRC